MGIINEVANSIKPISHLYWDRYPRPEDLRKTVSRKSSEWKKETKTKPDPRTKFASNNEKEKKK